MSLDDMTVGTESQGVKDCNAAVCQAGPAKACYRQHYKRAAGQSVGSVTLPPLYGATRWKPSHWRLVVGRCRTVMARRRRRNSKIVK